MTFECLPASVCFGHRWLRSVPTVVTVVLCMTALCPSALAREFELRGEDLRIVGETQWTGGGWGGYHPIRCEITNFGPGRDVELLFQPHDPGRGTPTVRRRLRLEQNATARVTLAVPLVGGRSSGRLDVRVAGTGVPGLNVDLALAGPSDGEFPYPSLLIVAPNDVPTRGFDIAMGAAAQSIANPGYPRGHFLTRRRGMGEVRRNTVAPTSLPTAWIDYSAVDIVAMRLDVLESLRPDERAAIFDWVATGGRLIVDRVDAVAVESSRLRDVLTTTGTDGQTFPWEAADGTHRQPLLLPDDRLPGEFSAIPNEGSPLSIARDVLPREMQQQLDMIESAIGRPANLTMAEPSWSPDPPPFFVKRIGFGRIAAVTGDVFSGNGADWTWLLTELGGPAIVWPVRQGMLSGRGDMEFINQPIPGVRGVPTIAFLTLITLFTLAIGPVNYFLLWRRKQLSRLVVTVPALAAVTSLILFSYAAFAHGFSTKGRIRSVTLLDAGTNTATTISRLALFSGRTPTAGLTFSNDTAVFPMYPFQEQFQVGEVDWTEAQTLTGGWLKTRTRTQFLTINRRDERGRLVVTPNGNGLRVVNGFEVPFTYLVVTDAAGKAYFAEHVAAGSDAVAKPLTDADWGKVREFALDRILEPPPGIEPDEIADGLWGDLRWRWREPTWQPQFREGLLERHLARLIEQTPKQSSDTLDSPDPPAARATHDAAAGDNDSGATETGEDDGDGDPSEIRIDRAVVDDTIDLLAKPRHFLAIASENPRIDTGGLEVDEYGSVHVMMGRW